MRRETFDDRCQCLNINQCADGLKQNAVLGYAALLRYGLMNAQNSLVNNPPPKVRTDGFMRLSDFLRIRTIVNRIDNKSWYTYFETANGRFSYEDTDNATLMILRRCLIEDAEACRFDIGYESQTIPKHWYDLWIRARNGHSDADQKEHGLSEFLDFRGWYKFLPNPFPELRSGCVWITFKLDQWIKVHEVGILPPEEQSEDAREFTCQNSTRGS